MIVTITGGAQVGALLLCGRMVVHQHCFACTRTCTEDTHALQQKTRIENTYTHKQAQTYAGGLYGPPQRLERAGVRADFGYVAGLVDHSRQDDVVVDDNVMVRWCVQAAVY